MKTIIEKHDGIIKIELPGMTPRNVHKIQECFHRLIETRFFLNSGEITLHFSDGVLVELWTKQKKWRREKLDKGVGLR